ncbi:MAG: chemotaxis protein CheW, partial [Wenzhouxiangellaceae bacterium]
MALLPAIEVLGRIRRQGALPLAPDRESDNANESRRRRGVRIGEYNLLLNDHIVAEIVESATIRRVPFAQAFCRGLTNLRGNLVTIFDLESLLSGAADAGPAESAAQPDSARWTAHERKPVRLLVMQTRPAWTGFDIKSLPRRIETVPSNSVRPAIMPPPVIADHLR